MPVARNYDHLIFDRIQALDERIHADRARSRAMESILSPMSWLLTISSLLLFVYWMVFDSGIKELYPTQYHVLVTLVTNAPGHPSHIDSLLATQGYVSWWQLTDAIQQVEASIYDERQTSSE